MENNDKKKYCSICEAEAPEDAAILALGRLGYPRYLCEECDAFLGEATAGREYESISEAFDKLGARIKPGVREDEIVMEALEDILGRAKERALSIKNGDYDFSQEDVEEELTDENTVQVDSEGLPFGEEEELSEEEVASREKAERTEAKINTITSWACGVVFVAVLGYCIWRIFFG